MENWNGVIFHIVIASELSKKCSKILFNYLTDKIHLIYKQQKISFHQLLTTIILIPLRKILNPHVYFSKPDLCEN